MIAALLRAATEPDEPTNVWGLAGLAISTVGALLAAWFARRSAKNTGPNGGSSPHDEVIARVKAVADALDAQGARTHDELAAQGRRLQLLDERALASQQTAQADRERILHELDRTGARMDEQAAMVDRVHRRLDHMAAQIDATGAQGEALEALFHEWTRKGA